MALRLANSRLINLSNPDLKRIKVNYSNVVRMEAIRMDMAVFTKIFCEGNVIRIDQKHMNNKHRIS
jgi:hypothetical protein